MRSNRQPTPADPPPVTAIDIVGGRDWVLTVHDGPSPRWNDSMRSTEGETRLGALDAAGFVAAVADEVLADYLELVEDIEREIDRSTNAPCERRRADDVLGRIVALRRRIGLICGGRSHRIGSPSPRWPAPRWRSMTSSASPGRA